MPNWLIPMVYTGGSLLSAVLVPRLEHAYFKIYLNDISVASALAYLSAIASGMMALTAIVFSIAYITVQFNAIAYSPRLALWFADDPSMFHALGIFISTFCYALGTMAWVDRGGSGGVPLVSVTIVLILLVLSMLFFMRLVRGIADLQITNTLHFIGDSGRAVIHEMYPRLGQRDDVAERRPMDPDEYARLGKATQTLIYAGPPRSIAKFDLEELALRAEQDGAVFELACAVGDTIVDDTLLVSVYGAAKALPEADLRRLIHLKRERTFEQDPKYPLRLLVDIAIKALSPAINDPTTAVQAIDQLEDLLRRLGRRELDVGYLRDASGALRVIFPAASWEDYLRLAFDEIRQFGGGSVQIMRRLRSALTSLTEELKSDARAAAVRQYLKQLDLVIERSSLDPEDRVVASQEDRQGLGLARKRKETPVLSTIATAVVEGLPRR